MRPIRYAFSFSILLLWAAACSTATEQPIPRFVALEFEAEGINAPITQNSDTLRVSEVKFLSTRFRIIDQDSLILQSSERIEPFLFRYDETFESPFLSLDIQLQFDDVAPIIGYEMEQRPLRQGDPVLDDEFRGTDETFSLIFKGRINRRSFIYQTGLSFDKSVELEPVQLTDNAETLLISKSIDLEAIFTNPEGGFYSPDSDEDMQMVEQAFEQQLQISAEALAR